MKNGYNLCEGGGGCRGYKHTEEELSKMRAIHNPEPVLQMDENFQIIRQMGVCITKWKKFRVIFPGH